MASIPVLVIGFEILQGTGMIHRDGYQGCFRRVPVNTEQGSKNGKKREAGA